MSAAHDHTRRTFARMAGMLLLVWGVSFAGVCAVIAIGVFVFAVWMAFHGGGASYVLLAAAAVVGGVVLTAIGAGKAMAGWILVKEDRKL